MKLHALAFGITVALTGSAFAQNAQTAQTTAQRQAAQAAQRAAVAAKLQADAARIIAEDNLRLTKCQTLGKTLGGTALYAPRPAPTAIPRFSFGPSLSAGNAPGTCTIRVPSCATGTTLERLSSGRSVCLPANVKGPSCPAGFQNSSLYVGSTFRPGAPPSATCTSTRNGAQL